MEPSRQVLSEASGRRQRGHQACEICHQRKVRCDVALIGTPCSACNANGAICKLRSRKAYSARRSRRPLEAGTSPAKETAHDHDSQREQTNTRAESYSIASESPRNNPTMVSRVTETQQWSPQADSDAGLNSRSDATKFANAIIEGGSTTASGNTAFFVGDKQGIGSILDVLDTDGTKHYTVPRLTAKVLQADDLIYLKTKGCFSLPSQVVCQRLLRSYFYHVHPSFPIVDTTAVLGAYSSGGFQNVNLLLLWSMFSVSASYIETATVQLAGYSSRKEMKHSIYQRAKCLYDNGHEEDKVALLQSALLLGFWFSDAEDRTGSWHWTGVAIGLAQTLGLYRASNVPKSNRILAEKEQLWRRLWWSCFFRDRWLSLGMGRPMRINLGDCDCGMLTIEDVVSDSQKLPRGIVEAYLPPDLVILVTDWINLIHLSSLLGTILIGNYRPHKQCLQKDEVEDIEDQISRLHCAERRNSELSKFSEKSFQLFKEAAMIALYRPYTVEDEVTALAVPSVASAKQKIKYAAKLTNNILDDILGASYVGMIGPMIPMLLAPAMQSHLLDAISNDQLTRSIGTNRLNLCLLVLQELEQNYPSASIILVLFTQALKKATKLSEVKPEAKSVSSQSVQSLEDMQETPQSLVSPQSIDSSAFEAMISQDPTAMNSYWQSASPLIPQSIYSSKNGTTLNSLVDSEEWNDSLIS